MKTCSKCGETKSYEEFGKAKQNKDGYLGKCKTCQKEYLECYYQRNREKRLAQVKEYNNKPGRREKRLAYMKAYQADPKNRDRYRANHLRRKYGMSFEEYESRLKEQGGTCAICDRDETSQRYGVLAVDHDHETGEVRGLLCSHCNRALGYLRDDISLLKAAVSYLEQDSPVLP